MKRSNIAVLNEASILYSVYSEWFLWPAGVFWNCCHTALCH